MELLNEKIDSLAVSVFPAKIPSGKLAILLPGFLDTKDYDHITSLGKLLSENGFDVASFDPTGTWNSGSSLGEYTISKYIANVEQVISHFESRERFNEIILIGHSLGGIVGAYETAVNEKISGVILITSPQYFVRPENFEEREVKWKTAGTKISHRDLPKNRSQKTSFGVPYSFVEDSKNYNSMEVVGKIKKPILFLAGEVDQHFTPDHMKQVYERANEPKSFVVVNGVGHDYRFHKDQIDRVNGEILKFLQQNNL
jgi:pimeloyl-ACP methyl ester carboxylesterase